MTPEDLKACEGICVQLNVGREVWLSTLRIEEEARLTDFRPTNEDPYESAPRFSLTIDDRLVSALRRDGLGRLIAEADWLVSSHDKAAAA